MDERKGQPTELGSQAEETYSAIRNCVVTAQNKVTAAVNTAMVHAYHELANKSIKPAEKASGPGTGSISCNTLRSA